MASRSYQADGPQAEIVAQLRARGAMVRLIEGANSQRGVPDLLVGVGGRTYLLEVKRGPGVKLRPAQEQFFATWPGGPSTVVHDVAGALAFCGLA
jgi:Holliday junction resolvase